MRAWSTDAVSGLCTVTWAGVRSPGRSGRGVPEGPRKPPQGREATRQV